MLLLCMCVYLFKTFPILLNLVCTFFEIDFRTCYKNCMVRNFDVVIDFFLNWILPLII